MGIVGGIAGARKTTFLQHLGWGVVLNNDAFFAHFSFEMPPEAIDSYAVAHLAGVEKCKALGPLFDDAELDEQRAALEDALKLVGGRGHTFGVAQAKSVADMREIVEKLRSSTKVERGFIAIDSIHALTAHVARAARSERSALDAVLNDVREFADTLSVAVLCSAQLTKRGAELDGDFHFAQSAGADYTPDYTATLVTAKEGAVRPGAAPRPLRATLHVHKNRFGREGARVDLLYHPGRTRFEEASPALEGDDDDA